jgi:C4-dicarboxylate-specific signal transduction histidine kinase
MKPVTQWSFLVVTALALCLVSCNRTSRVDATQPLQESFKTAEPEVQQAIATVNTSLKANNYAEATRALVPVVTHRVLTEPQKQAVGVALQQINQAIAANPGLDTKEMYELRAKMFRAVANGPGS